MQWASVSLPLVLIVCALASSNGLSIDPGKILLLKTNPTVYALNESLTLVASSELEQIIKNDFVISLRHIRYL